MSRESASIIESYGRKGIVQNMQENEGTAEKLGGASIMLPPSILASQSQTTKKPSAREYRERSLKEDSLAKLPPTNGNAGTSQGGINLQDLTPIDGTIPTNSPTASVTQTRASPLLNINQKENKPKPQSETWVTPKGIPLSSCDREIVHIQIGRAGNNVSHEFWREITEEHGIWYKDYNRTYQSCHGKFYQSDDELFRLQQVNTLFYESSSGRYVPRAILLDLDAKFLDALVTTDLGRLYHPGNVKYSDLGSGNSYACAYNSHGRPLVTASMDIVASEMEKLDSLQGVTITHSMGGGTGSGIAASMIEEIKNFAETAFIQTYSLACSRMASDIVVEPYNAVLCSSPLIECSDQCLWFDNWALGQMNQRLLQVQTPEFMHNDSLMARLLAGMTSNLRFPGTLDADLHKMHTNLVPFPRCHFLLGGAAPVLSPQVDDYRAVTIQDMTMEMLKSENCILSVNPLSSTSLAVNNQHPARQTITKQDDEREGDEEEEEREGVETKTEKFLSIFCAFRGRPGVVAPSEIDECLWKLQNSSRYAQHFPEWIPCQASSSICTVPGSFDVKHEASMTYWSNTTAISQNFDTLLGQFSSLYGRKAYLHKYTEDGMECDTMEERFHNLRDLMDEYNSHATKDYDPFRHVCRNTYANRARISQMGSPRDTRMSAAGDKGRGGRRGDGEGRGSGINMRDLPSISTQQGVLKALRILDRPVALYSLNPALQRITLKEKMRSSRAFSGGNGLDVTANFAARGSTADARPSDRIGGGMTSMLSGFSEARRTGFGESLIQLHEDQL